MVLPGRHRRSPRDGACPRGVELGCEPPGGECPGAGRLLSAGRYARYRDVRKQGKWDLVRSHAPVLADGTTPATFDLVLSGIVFYAVTVSFVYDI